MGDRDIIRSQYQASLEMLRQTIAKCPEALWDDPGDKTRFWRIAYHALFYTHLYLQRSEREFVGWVKHRKDNQSLEPLPEPPYGQAASGEPYTRQDLLEYVEVCRQQIDEKTGQLDMNAESGFYWLPFNKLGLQIYNIRHLQQHTGELMERLGTRASIDVDWVGMKDA